MPEKLKVIGETYGVLTVLSDAPYLTKHMRRVNCLCKCGKETIVRLSSLRNGHTTSCGCVRYENIKDSITTHGLTNHRLYNIWRNMRQRCGNPKNTNYKHYGGRGIKVCKRWQNFYYFYIDVFESYKEGLELDRINVDGDYSPSNFRWATRKENCRNTRFNRVISMNGESRLLIEWANDYDISPVTIRSRLRRGWSVEKAITLPTK